MRIALVAVVSIPRIPHSLHERLRVYDNNEWVYIQLGRKLIELLGFEACQWKAPCSTGSGGKRADKRATSMSRLLRQTTS